MLNGGADIGDGLMSYVSSKYKEKHSAKTYNFAKYNTGGYDTNDDDSSDNKKTKFNPKKVDFKDENDEYNPVQNNETKYSFDEEGAIVIDLKNNDNN